MVAKGRNFATLCFIDLSLMTNSHDGVVHRIDFGLETCTIRSSVLMNVMIVMILLY